MENPEENVDQNAQGSENNENIEHTENSADQNLNSDDEESNDPPTSDIDIPEETAPGVGIDTDGDGNADEVTQEDGIPVHVDHEDDYIGKVRLSDNIGDAVDKKKANKLVKASNIHEHYKDIMLKQIKDGQLAYPYNETFKKIKAADDTDSIYRPGVDGL